MKKLFLIPLLLVLVVALVLGGCAKPAPEEKTLKIGILAWLGSPTGLDMVKGIELMVDMDNEKGGLEIGGERYKVELIVYDSNMNQSTEVAAVNRLVFEDNVKFILASDDPFVPAWLPTTEENKVITCALGMDYRTCLSPNNHYHFNGNFNNVAISAMVGWLSQNCPDLVKDIVMACPDDQPGHSGAESTMATWGVFGVTPTAIFYPPESADLSSLGTKVKTLNPGAFMAVAGGPVSDALALKAVYQAGYQGQLFATSGTEYLQLAQLFPAEMLEGFVNAAAAIEFDPPLTEAAREFKDAWIAKYGGWEGQEMNCANQYACLRAALQQAGSLDTDKVASVLSNGMKYESLNYGEGQMVSRPDLGNDRTVDSVTTYYVKQIKEGKPTLFGTISMEEALNYFHMAYPPAQGK